MTLKIMMKIYTNSNCSKKSGYLFISVGIIWRTLKNFSIMPTWLIIILVVAAIGAVIGFISSNHGERAEGAVQGALGGAMGCGYFLLHLFLWGLGVAFMIWLFGAIFG